MISTDQIRTVMGSHVVGNDGAKIGKAGQVYLDDQSGRPEWVTVHTGLFGKSESFIPLEAATLDGSTIRVPYTKDIVKGAPQAPPTGTWASTRRRSSIGTTASPAPTADRSPTPERTPAAAPTTAPATAMAMASSTPCRTPPSAATPPG